MIRQVIGPVDDDVELIAMRLFCKIGFAYSIMFLKPFGNR
jgi:hypothetical protein